jgi:hypothetical protein
MTAFALTNRSSNYACRATLAIQCPPYETVPQSVSLFVTDESNYPPPIFCFANYGASSMERFLDIARKHKNGMQKVLG